MIEHKGALHKGYINYPPVSGFQFIVRSNSRSRKVDFSVPLPDFIQHWTTLLVDDRLFPGHSTVSSFLKSATSCKNVPSLNYVYAKHLLYPCPTYTWKALDTSNPDRQVWLDSYNLFMKNEKDGKPLRAKSRIIVLGDFKDRLYQKSQRYAPVIKYSPLRLLTAKAVREKRILQQGDCRNKFCNTNLPGDEMMVIRPPIVNPDFQEDEYWLLNKTLYGLRQSPHHWYSMIKGILLKMGLKSSQHDPCLLSDVLANPSSPDTISEVQYQPHVEIYVNDFVFY